MTPASKTPWIALRVWACEVNGARTVNARCSLAALSAWKSGTRPPGTSFVAGAKVIDDPARVDWQDFPELEARGAAEELLSPAPTSKKKTALPRGQRRTSTMQIATLREIGQDPEGVARRHLHGARAHALLNRGLIEIAHEAGETVRRISTRGRELLHHLDAEGSASRRRRAKSG